MLYPSDKHDKKQHREERIYLAYTSQSLSLREEVRTGTQSRNWEAGTEEEAKEKAKLSYSLQDHLVRNGTVHTWYDLPM